MADQSGTVTGYPLHSAANGYPNTATTYPYVAPPPQNQPTCFHVTGNHHNSDPDAPLPPTTFFDLFFAVLIVSALIFIFIITWLIHRPQIPQFRVETLTLTNFNISSNSLISSNWDVRFNVRNPNSKITLYYDQIEAAIFYKSDSIAGTTVPPFVQGTKNETVVRATFASLMAYIDDHGSINGERIHGTVKIYVRMMARVQFKAGGWWDSWRILRVYCPNLSVGVSANSTGGSLVGGSKECMVD